MGKLRRKLTGVFQTLSAYWMRWLLFALITLSCSAATIHEYPLSADSRPLQITAGPDGNLWFTEPGTDKIGRITRTGIITEFPAMNVGRGIAAGPDGNLWFAEGTNNKIGRMTISGVITEFPVPTANSAPDSITTGPDGNLWFTETDVGKIGRITTSGVITEFAIPTTHGQPRGITAGPDGNLWFTEFYGKIGQIVLATIASSPSSH